MNGIELLRQEKLTGMIKEFDAEDLSLKKAGVLAVENEPGETFSWDIQRVPRGIPGFQGDHSPAKPQKLTGMGQRSAKLGKVFLSKNLKASLFNQLRQPGSEVTMKAAESKIVLEEREMAASMDRLEEFLIASAIQGSIETTVDDLEIEAIDFGIPADNVFAYNGVGDLGTGDWLDPSTDLVGAFRKFQKAARRAVGKRLEVGVITDLVQEAMLKNEHYVRIMRSTAAGVAALESGEMGPFMGIKRWVVVNHAYKNEAGDDVLYFPENLAAFLPAASTDWGSLVYGSDLIPKDEGDGFKEVQGRYSYSEMQKNPAGITLYGGLRLLPVIKKAGSIVKVTVTAA